MTHRSFSRSVVIAFAVPWVACGCAATTAGGAVAASGTAQSRDSASPVSTLGNFSLRDVNGKIHSLSDYLGEKVVLIAFWATWCEPCKRKTVQHQELFDRYAEKGLVVLAVSMDEPETQSQVRIFARQRRLTFPVLLDTESQAVQLFNPRRTAPFSLLIGRNGRIAWEHEGWVAGDERTLEDEVVRALGLQ
jgi:peroxiredoxin